VNLFCKKKAVCTLSSIAPRMSLVEDFAKAIESGDSSQVESLLTNGSIDVNARLPRDNNPPALVFAVMCDKCGIDIVGMLLDAGARIDDVDDLGQTACFTAALFRRGDVMASLLERRPNLEIKSRSFHATPLHFLLTQIASECVDIAIMLINAGASLDVSPYHSALGWFASASTAAIEALINRGVVMNQLLDAGNLTPLHAIARRPAWTDVDAVANMLINDCGVDVEARNVQGESCAHFAARSGNDIALRCFIDAGADVNCANRNGRTPLYNVYSYACSILLLVAGANVHARDREGLTALTSLQCKPTCHWRAILHTLLAAGADPSDLSEQSVALVDPAYVEYARREIAATRLEFVRKRAIEVCFGLQSLQLDALQMCEILKHACGPVAHVVAFHQWWSIATTVKHFLER
jgi:ankyrin repeat protein